MLIGCSHHSGFSKSIQFAERIVILAWLIIIVVGDESCERLRKVYALGGLRRYSKQALGRHLFGY